MVDISAIAGMMTSLRAASDITTAMIGLRDAAQMQSKVIELQQLILAAQSSALSAQSDHFTLNERIRQLEDEKAKLEAWQAERDRYQLTDYGENTFAYELKPEKADGEPAHRLCPNCFNQGTKAILQFEFRNMSNQDRYNCYHCKAAYSLGTPAKSRPSSPRGSGGSWMV